MLFKASDISNLLYILPVLQSFKNSEEKAYCRILRGSRVIGLLTHLSQVYSLSGSFAVSQQQHLLQEMLSISSSTVRLYIYVHLKKTHDKILFRNILHSIIIPSFGYKHFRRPWGTLLTHPLVEIVGLDSTISILDFRHILFPHLEYILDSRTVRTTGSRIQCL